MIRETETETDRQTDREQGQADRRTEIEQRLTDRNRDRHTQRQTHIIIDRDRHTHTEDRKTDRDGDRDRYSLSYLSISISLYGLRPQLLKHVVWHVHPNPGEDVSDLPRLSGLEEVTLKHTPAGRDGVPPSEWRRNLFAAYSLCLCLCLPPSLPPPSLLRSLPTSLPLSLFLSFPPSLSLSSSLGKIKMITIWTYVLVRVHGGVDKTIGTTLITVVLVEREKERVTDGDIRTNHFVGEKIAL